MKIETTILGGNLFDCGNWDNVDLSASFKKYVKLVELAMSKQFPDAEIVFFLEENVSGYSGRTYVDLSKEEVKEWSEDSVRELVNSIKEDIYSSYEWIVNY